MEANNRSDSKFSPGCRLCPRDCRVERGTGKKGFCGESETARLALATRHFGEEPCLVGTCGSGTVFFTGCTLRCSFCQNCQLSRHGGGRTVEVEELARIVLALQAAGAVNINFVTGTHFAPQIARAVDLARGETLSVPVVWNSSGYENDNGLDIIETFADIFLPDLKTLDPQVSGRLFRAPDYPARARAAILRMAEHSRPIFDGDGLLTAGTIVRHLVLPGMVAQTKSVLEWYAENLTGRALLSLMFQYLPPSEATDGSGIPGRMVEDAEYYQVIGILEDLGIEDGYIQEMEPESPWMPNFDAPNAFPEEYSKVVWHWKNGFV